MNVNIVLPEFTSHSDVVAYANGELLKSGLRGLERVAVEAALPDLRTPAELGAADSCWVDNCDEKVFIDTRFGLCQRHQAGQSLKFIFGS